MEAFILGAELRRGAGRVERGRVGWMDGWVDGRTDGWAVGRMERWVVGKGRGRWRRKGSENTARSKLIQV